MQITLPAAVVAELIEKLGRAGAPLAAGLLQRVGELCSAEEEMDDDDDGEGGPGRDQVLVAAQNALGAAMRALGPEAVLEALPLQLVEVRRGCFCGFPGGLCGFPGDVVSLWMSCCIAIAMWVLQQSAGQCMNEGGGQGFGWRQPGW